MKFTLTYDGELRSRGDTKHIHAIRQNFHSQLTELWKQIPLSGERSWFDGTNPNTTVNLNRQIESFRFVPLISPSLHLICELHIFLLKPGQPGSIITQAGDIDNRLKTLFDALRVPNKTEIPIGVTPQPTEDPFFCLLEDDALISKVSVDTDRLLKTTSKPTEVILVIQVETRPTQTIIGHRASGNLSLL
jgi:hypothetical protein